MAALEIVGKPQHSLGSQRNGLLPRTMGRGTIFHALKLREERPPETSAFRNVIEKGANLTHSRDTNRFFGVHKIILAGHCPQTFWVALGYQRRGGSS